MRSTQDSSTFEEKWGIPAEERALLGTEGLLAAATGCDGMLFLWPCDHESASPPCVRCVPVHHDVATDFVMDWSNLVSISCGADCSVSVFDLRSEKRLGRVASDKTKESSHKLLSVDGDYGLGKVVAGDSQGMIKIGDLHRAHMLFGMKGHTDSVYQVRADWRRNQVVSCSWDKSLNVFDVRSGKKSRTLLGHKAICNRMDVDFDVQLAVSVAWERQFILWDLKQGDIIKSYPSHAANDVSVDWQSMKAATGADDGLVKMWDLKSGLCVSTIDCEHDQTLALDVNWDLGLLLTASWDQQVKLFDLATEQCLKKFCKARRVLTQCLMKKSRSR
mmetsp:Transcript_5943/g.14102  ORF Transcript_5943/g.14102 Transcript_5943/m.14102 type:complete len:332 (+) Transcript_5943:66-1061(+)